MTARPPAALPAVIEGPPAVIEAPPAAGEDAGMTLAELAVGMLVLGIFLAILSMTLLSLAGFSRQHANLAAAEQSARQAFLVLDKQVRYADAVTTPATIAGDQWIEWRVPDPTIPLAQSASQSRCYQWRASGTTGLLQYRAWIVPTSGSVATPVWVTVASGLNTASQAVFTTSTAGLAATPFQVPSTVATYGLAYTRVGVALKITFGAHATASTATLFTVPNASSASTPSVCTQVPRS